METVLESIRNTVETSYLFKVLNDHRIATACVSATLLYGAWYLKRPRNLPPGPWGYPLVGSSRSLEQTQDLGFGKLAEKYGDVFCLWMGGNRYSVVLSSYGAIKEAYTRGTDFMDRDAEKLKQLLGVDDTIVTSRYNELYKSSRKVGSQALRNLISSKLEGLMDTELQDLNQVIDSSLGRAVDASRDLQRVLTNTIGQLLFSKRYQHGDQDLDDFINNIHLWFQCVAEVDTVLKVPSIIAKVFMSKNIAAYKKTTKDLLDFLRIHVDEHLKSFDKGNMRDVIDAFILDKDQSGYTVEQITSNVMMMLPDASFTVYEIVLWVLLYLVNNPQSQEEIYNEIHAVCDSGKVSIKDRARLLVTESFIMEVMRVVSPIQIGLDNKPLHSTTFRGYNIPEYVNITPYYGIVHRDPQLFPEPEEFRPHRFIKNGKIGNTEGFMPFGTGRRMCMGEQLARSEIFYIVTGLVKQYKMHSPDGTPLSTECGESGVVKAPKEYSVIFEKR